MATTEEDNAGKDGRWTPEEHRKFVEAYEAIGRDWKRIQAAVETRSLQQVRSHGQKYFQRLERHHRAKALRSNRDMLQQQNALMRSYLQALTHINLAFFTEMSKLHHTPGEGSTVDTESGQMD